MKIDADELTVTIGKDEGETDAFIQAPDEWGLRGYARKEKGLSLEHLNPNLIAMTIMITIYE